jgi:hypothetical protein
MEAAPEFSELGEALDFLIQRWGGGEHTAEIARARDEHGERTGKVFEDDELYELRTIAFLEWYVLERPLEARGLPPVLLALAEDPGSPHAGAWRALARSHRSLFAIDELEDGKVALTDLLGGGRFTVAERRRLHGVSIGDVVAARLIGWRDQVLFGRTFCYHPAGAREAIIAHCRRIRAGGGTRGEAIDYIASLRVRADRYRHVAPARVYEAATSELK